MVKDMYADLEKIEARGKRKKEKNKGLFSSFGKKDEPEPVPEPQASPEPVPKVVRPEPPKPEPVKKTSPVPQPKPVQEPVARPAPKVESPPPQPVPKPIIAQSAPEQSAPETNNGWEPLTGGKLKKAEVDILTYKKWLNNGYKSGILTREQCTDMVRKKEIELGLRAPE
ncbi:MAG: procyclic acidic repetitive family protein [Candidatus Thermoplasmatota archaeon]|nr:hypothetical protein [Euryarchaeota archaeon]MBU4032547.1 procyclic acidic repetitive family protein [Candidatus Thermoplasmatota archaeon]MBU4072020.1 procyclic acidic repetitive family protein [Candidatus Thermoplasmatota archaeon]MBU4144551.1 procyclic acidic repetitive family protein [Candidatus Thermoplasmatota archaeon]MBU4592100.1 procyclic acidic repetitive family protein [Candidatus Thermoplasmatota archaeon]